MGMNENGGVNARMARYTGPVCRLCRREGIKLYLKGDRCFSDKCAIDKRPYAPGQHGQGRKRASEYGSQLREKQKARRYYGVLEGQFERYYEEAARRRGVTGETLLALLESRLDNIVYRLGFAASRAEARQLVRHGHLDVNGHRVDIPSFLVREGDVVAIREKSREIGRVKELAEVITNRTIPAWLELDAEKLSGKMLRKPEREEIDTPVAEQMIVEHYSR